MVSGKAGGVKLQRFKYGREDIRDGHRSCKAKRESTARTASPKRRDNARRAHRRVGFRQMSQEQLGAAVGITLPQAQKYRYRSRNCHRSKPSKIGTITNLIGQEFPSPYRRT
jgi:hypothetical protein